MAQLGNSKVFGNLEVTGELKKGGVSVVTISDTQTLTNKTLTSPILNGTPTAPTATVGDSSTQIATTAFVNAEIQNDSTSANTANLLVRRDASGNFSAGTITAALTGNAATATKWATGRTIALTGDVTGTSGTFDGSGNLSFATTVVDDSHNHTTLTGVTSISFAAEASDSMSLSRTINATGTYFDFNLADDNNNDWWRWRFTPSGSTVYDAMILKPSANGIADLVVSGKVTGTQLVSNVAIGTAPLVVTSTTKVANLNAEKLDDLEATQFVRSDAIGTLDAGNSASPFTIKRSSATAQQVSLALQTTDGTTTFNGFIGISSGVLKFGDNADIGGTGYKIWHSGNDGANSTLDADLLDGQEGSYYAPIDSPKFTGSVGVGTTAPTTKLHIQNDLNTSVENWILKIQNNNSETNTPTAGIKFVVGDNTSEKGGIIWKRTTSYGRGDMFFLNNNAADATGPTIASDAAMMIKAGGNIGMGTNSPATKLHIATNGTGLQELVRVHNSYGDAYLSMSVGDTQTVIKHIEGTTDATNGHGKIIFQSNASKTVGVSDGGFWFQHTDGTELMRIRMDGYVGIGTSAPQSKLNVVGGAIQVGLNTDANYIAIGSNDLSFNRNNMSYINQTVIGGSLVFRTTTSTSADTTVLSLSSGEADFTGNVSATGTIQHTGLSPTAGTNIDQVYTVTDSLTLTASWQNTSVDATELQTGTYVVQVMADDYGVGGQQYTEYYSGVMSWFGGGTNSTAVDEIALHRAGHAPNGGAIFLRVQRNSGGNLRLQISGLTANTGASNYTFKFRRMI